MSEEKSSLYEQVTMYKDISGNFHDSRSHAVYGSIMHKVECAIDGAHFGDFSARDLKQFLANNETIVKAMMGWA